VFNRCSGVYSTPFDQKIADPVANFVNGQLHYLVNQMGFNYLSQMLDIYPPLVSS